MKPTPTRSPAPCAWRAALALLALLTLSAPVARAAPPAEATTRQAAALPSESITHHTLVLPDRTLHITAIAGSEPVRLGEPASQAAVATTAYLLDGADPATRPVAFVFNGGPGFASAWLQLGALGPWHLPMDATAISPSARPALLPNADTWLDFTDLVFIDPPGTGYSEILGGEAARHRLWSVDGDIAALAEVIRRWLDEHGRIAAPKLLVGESYGGFRVPLLARALASQQGVGVRGLVMISPLLDFGRDSSVLDPLSAVGRLPSLVAVARSAQGPVTRASLAAVEHYASTDYLLDLLRGESDPAAVARLVDRLTALTGLDRTLLRERDGRIDVATFLHAIDRHDGRIASRYDASITMPDPYPATPGLHLPDPVLDALEPPLTEAMALVYDRLAWHPAGLYRLGDRSIARQWDWGDSFHPPESFTALRTALAFDPHLHALIIHGLFDLVTPYFATRLLLDQIPAAAGGERVQLLVLPGGHMPYTEDASRAALRQAAQGLVAASRSAHVSASR